MNFTPCRRCKGNLLPDGFILDRGGEVIECDCHKRWKEEKELEIKLKESNIPPSILNKSFEDYVGKKSLDSIEKLKKFIDKFEEIGYRKCLYLFGPNGTQKTTSAYIVAKQLLTKNKSVFYVRTLDLITKHFGNFNQSEEDLHFVKKIEESDLVIIDECFARKRQESVSDYQLVNIRNFLKDRIEIIEKSIIFISNYSVEEIQKQGFDKGVYDLIKRNTQGKTLEFLDNYMENITDFDIDELFT